MRNHTYKVGKVSPRSWENVRKSIMKIEIKGFSPIGLDESEDDLEEIFEISGAIRLLARDEEKRIVGYLIAYPKKSSKCRTMYLSTIAVLPEHRGKGAGRKMLKKLVFESRKAGYERVTGHFLDVSETLFRNLGGKIVKEYLDFHGKGKHATYMELFI